MLPDFNRLKVFYHIYTLNSIVGAANKLHLSQPAISQQLQKLEAELKVPLFTRLHKKLVPTAAGERLFTLVEPFVVKLEDEISYIRQPSDRPAGTLRIGAPREFGKEYLPRFCHEFRRLYPDVMFKLKFKESIPLLTMIREGKLDYALVDVYFNQVELPSFPDIFSIDPLLKEEMVLVCSKEYYQERIAGDHSFKNLLDKEYITDEDDPSILALWFKHHFQKIPESLNVVMTLDSHEALISGLKLGMGLGVATSYLIWEEIQKGEIIPIATTKNVMVNMISLVQLQDKVPTLTEKTFRDFMIAGMQKKQVLERFQCIGS
ncbi:DNA-binding transcriptional regulator, LysR family [Desulfuromusa kysingii]|uniref:DNA-binding transcriptional regulator, LysR family n=1 Tax=Desulfuromusa kysingii TaxID=37625 RepID=A0A1H4DEZ0_9BACT|nr:LysR family transcriptional regulator [Desulfuromusa kysingii]SEA70822.1 DNA-binding transcriptional regulator, LysR family [Desulfuromusa kysingii]